ncbi:MAG: hypothetical protein M0Z85_12780 [Gammaproteobacteria bacterium]|nr:hypothetical protein [Gammaproteobacteria bacterium]
MSEIVLSSDAIKTRIRGAIYLHAKNSPPPAEVDDIFKAIRAEALATGPDFPPWITGIALKVLRDFEEAHKEGLPMDAIASTAEAMRRPGLAALARAGLTARARGPRIDDWGRGA